MKRRYKKCVLCNKRFLVNNPSRKYCEECRRMIKSTKSGIYHNIAGIRKELWSLLDEGLYYAVKKFAGEMLEEEGEEFTKKVLGEKLYKIIFEVYD